MPALPTSQLVDSRWVRSLVQGMNDAIASAFPMGEPLEAEAYKRIASGYEIIDYGVKLVRHHSVLQKVDLLVSERIHDDRWTPRIAIECLTGDPQSRTALALHGRASQLKAVNPSMRFGAFVGGFAGPGLPLRLAKSCPALDFIAVWNETMPTREQWARIAAIIAAEVEASRTLEGLIFKQTKRVSGPLQFLHRGLTIE